MHQGCLCRLQASAMLPLLQPLLVALLLCLSMPVPGAAFSRSHPIPTRSNDIQEQNDAEKQGEDDSSGILLTSSTKGTLSTQASNSSPLLTDSIQKSTENENQDEDDSSGIALNSRSEGTLPTQTSNSRLITTHNIQNDTENHYQNQDADDSSGISPTSTRDTLPTQTSSSKLNMTHSIPNDAEKQSQNEDDSSGIATGSFTGTFPAQTTPALLRMAPGNVTPGSASSTPTNHADAMATEGQDMIRTTTQSPVVAASTNDIVPTATQPTPSMTDGAAVPTEDGTPSRASVTTSPLTRTLPAQPTVPQLGTGSVSPSQSDNARRTGVPGGAANDATATPAITPTPGAMTVPGTMTTRIPTIDAMTTPVTTPTPAVMTTSIPTTEASTPNPTKVSSHMSTMATTVSNSGAASTLPNGLPSTLPNGGATTESIGAATTLPSDIASSQRMSGTPAVNAPTTREAGPTAPPTDRSHTSSAIRTDGPLTTAAVATLPSSPNGAITQDIMSSTSVTEILTSSATTVPGLMDSGGISASVIIGAVAGAVALLLLPAIVLLIRARRSHQRRKLVLRMGGHGQSQSGGHSNQVQHRDRHNQQSRSNRANRPLPLLNRYQSLHSLVNDSRGGGDGGGEAAASVDATNACVYSSVGEPVQEAETSGEWDRQSFEPARTRNDSTLESREFMDVQLGPSPVIVLSPRLYGNNMDEDDDDHEYTLGYAMSPRRRQERESSVTAVDAIVRPLRRSRTQTANSVPTFCLPSGNTAQHGDAGMRGMKSALGMDTESEGRTAVGVRNDTPPPGHLVPPALPGAEAYSTTSKFDGSAFPSGTSERSVAQANEAMTMKHTPTPKTDLDVTAESLYLQPLPFITQDETDRTNYESMSSSDPEEHLRATGVHAAQVRNMIALVPAGTKMVSEDLLPGCAHSGGISADSSTPSMISTGSHTLGD